MRAVVLMGLVLTVGCPERKVPERGLELRYKLPASGREVVERRLAHAALKAKLIGDKDELTVRIPEGGDAESVKRVLLEPGVVELCEELISDAKAWCDVPAPEGVTRATEPQGCFFEAAAAATARKAGEAKSTGRVLVQQVGKTWRTFAAPKSCLSPRFIDGTVKERDELGPRRLNLTLDPEGAQRFEQLTGHLVHQRLLIVLDGEVTMAPVVQEAIPGGKIRLDLAGEHSAGELKVLLSSLVGGPLPGIELLEERTYGPPTLR